MGRPMLDRLMERTRIAGSCWEWTGSKTRERPTHGRGGYGKFTWWEGGRVRSGLAHRLVYELLVGPIPDGLTIDHLCRNPSCVNPDHMEPVPLIVNIRRGLRTPGHTVFDAVTTNGAVKAHCKHGHEYTAANVRWNKAADKCMPGPVCKTCESIRNKKYRDQRKARRFNQSKEG